MGLRAAVLPQRNNITRPIITDTEEEQ